MGDDLGDEWEMEEVDGGGEETSALDSAAATVAPKAIKNKNKNKNKDSSKNKKQINAPDAGDGGPMAGRKRGRSQLSAEGFEEIDGEEASESEGDGEEEDEEARLKAEEEEEAKRKRAEKKKEKLKALKAKMKEKKKQRTAEEEQGAPTEGKGKWGSGSVGRGGTEAAAELWSKFCKVRRDLVTPLEMDSPWITSKSLALVDGFGAHTAIKLVGFIKASLPDWKKRIQNRDNNAPRGSPSVLIICAGARRCVEVMKHLTAFRCQVVKLFAKHLKIEEQKVMLRKGCFPLAVGTPGRMQALAAAGSLRLDSSALIVLDMEKNIKGRDVLDMDGVANDTMAFLAEYVRPHLASSSAKGKAGGGGAQGKGKGAPGQLRIAMY
eukprot:jgi/Undpi1/7334/HiC_scaffold_22.g09807.m1